MTTLPSMTVTVPKVGQTATSGANTYHSISTNGLFEGSSGSLNVNGSWSSGFVQFPSTTLSNVGDYVTLSFSVQYAIAPATTSGALRFGLFNSGGGTARLYPYNETTNDTGGTATGYFAAVNTGGTNDTSMYRNSGDTTGSTVMNTTTTGARLIGFNGASFGTTAQTVTLTITRTDTDKISLKGSIAGTTFSITNAAQVGTPVTYTFDSFVFGAGNLANGYTIDNLSIITNASAVPEPSTVALLAGGCAAGITLLARHGKR
ncbi:PEP-CTERM sorting domain-containing protein [Geminisphaera colitermitum]|uniref:PEP-CTERM sorting domain-containing protein n=1 Tax=Geminisphaera colitermitum TaxID=1148786 RepID=UPI0012FEC0FA|nr:PEP-CTERM sorting domain-containing protein [Geminisphaera colitermitum]